MDLFQLFYRTGMFLSSVIDENTKKELSGAATEAVANVTAAATEAVQQAAEPAGLGALLPTVLIYGVFIVGIYFFMFRQPRKQAKAKTEMRDNIRTGDMILTTAGFYGKVVDIGTDVFVVEFGDNRGVRVPVRKDAVEGIKSPVLTPPPKDAESK